MKFDLSLGKHNGFAGFTICKNVTICLRNIYSERDLLEVLKHEVLHAVFNEIGEKTNAKKDHYIMKRLESEWF